METRVKLHNYKPIIPTIRPKYSEGVQTHILTPTPSMSPPGYRYSATGDCHLHSGHFLSIESTNNLCPISPSSLLIAQLPGFKKVRTWNTVTLGLINILNFFTLLIIYDYSYH